jgi:hypothetical protein
MVQHNKLILDRHTDGNDRDHMSALAAHGYWQTFQIIKVSIRKVLEGVNPGEVFEQDHGNWYREMFGPSVYGR